MVEKVKCIMIELLTTPVADQLRINKAENQRRDLISQASTVWSEYNDTLSTCQGLQIPESGFNPGKMAAVFSEVTLPSRFERSIRKQFCCQKVGVMLIHTLISSVCPLG